ncbi:MAG: alpha-L-fucosidase [Rikenellaceae bacterium]
MKKIILFFACFTLLNSCSEEQPKPQKYNPTWESLANHNEQPEWLKDAKLGIYFHWGAYCVPAFQGEWYPRNMYRKGDNAYNHHRETYGDDFNYHDFVPMFKAEKFDPAKWAELFKEAGAKFAGPVAEHHDGFSMWDSEVTPWNSMDKGPKRDILGELYAEFDKVGLKTIATFHHARNRQRYSNNWQEEVANKGNESWRKFQNSHYPYFPEYQEVFNDPENAMLYGTAYKEDAEWEEKVWLAKLEEVIDKYRPDIIWFDSWLDQISEINRQKFAAYYLNAAEEWKKEVVIVRKQEDLPLEVSINDHEKSREPKVQENLWMTDDTFSTGSWCYTENLKIKPTSMIVHSLIDAVSKNGVLLLNISPMADGTIPDNQVKGLKEIGVWLEKYGEAIYNTRPWKIAGEGPTVEPEGGFSDNKKFLQLKYSSKDIRYTASKDKKTIYAFVMGIPTDNETIAMSNLSGLAISNVEALTGDKIDWEMGKNGLSITVKNSTGQYAYPIKISLK